MEFKEYIDVKRSSNRSFGIVFCIVFSIIGVWPLYQGKEINDWAIILALLFLSVSIFFPHVYRIPNKVWVNFGNFIGKIVSPIVMLLLYIGTIVPTNLVIRVMKKDILRLKFKSELNSYWLNRDIEVGSMKNQF